MINTIELEKRWLRYKTKIFRSLLFIIFFVLAIPYLSYYLFQQYTLIIEKEKSISKVERQDEQLNVKDELAPKVENINDVVLAPSIPIIDFNNEKQMDRVAEKKKIEQKEEKQKIEQQKIEQKKAEKSRLDKKQAYRQKMAKRRALEKKRALEKNSSERKNLIKAKGSSALTSSELGVVNGANIDRKESKKITFHTTSNNYMPIMKRKFEQNKNPREAILIAKAYYKAGNYVESEKWALIANNLDKNSEESWFLFAKSKAKLGKRREALKILVSYHKKTKSPQAKELIEKIQSRSI
jgi:tetratricopeptide (TPR) repeat protein